MQKGYIAILTVLIISAVVITIATTVSLLAIGEAQSSFALFKGEDTLTFVEGCMEDALLKARNNNSYTSGSITRPEGTCTITVSKAGTTWTVTATTTSTQYVRTVQAVITRGSQMAITSWKEL
ncbi:MAG TPA: hypothetical protein VLF89_03540 [Candidatus Saccharimonadales bacterium]|nr:hypothetical protein [Candidatus Saccharimonadales bacterium]